MGDDNKAILDAIAKLNSDLNTSIKELREDLKSTNKNIEEKFKNHDSILDMHGAKISFQDKEYRKKNLLIHGIREGDNSYPTLENLVLDLLNNTLKVNTTITEIDHIRRLGPKAEGKIRPIQIRFLAYRKVIQILSNRKHLKNTNINIWEDLPKEIIEERRGLIPIMKKFRQNNQHAVIKYNKLYVDGKVFSKDESTIPEQENKKRQLSDDTSVEKQPKDRKMNSIRRSSVPKIKWSSQENITQYFSTAASITGSQSGPSSSSYATAPEKPPKDM